MTRTRLVRRRRIGALAFAVGVALALAGLASAEASWIEGQMVRSTVVNCETLTLGNPVATAGVLAQVGFRATPRTLPRVGRTFYARVFVGGSGAPCVTQMAWVEVVLPLGVRLAITRRTPVRCSSFTVAPASPVVPAQGCPRRPFRGQHGFVFPRTTRTDGLWALPRGQGYFIDFPIRSSRRLRGIARGLPSCAGPAPCPASRARDSLQVGIKVSDGNDNPWLVPYVGLFTR